MFLDICKGPKALGHINGNQKPTKEDNDDWEYVHSQFKSWLWSTCEPNLSQMESDNCIVKDLYVNDINLIVSTVGDFSVINKFQCSCY